MLSPAPEEKKFKAPIHAGGHPDGKHPDRKGPGGCPFEQELAVVHDPEMCRNVKKANGILACIRQGLPEGQGTRSLPSTQYW